MQLELTLYSRRDCHLCDEMRFELEHVCSMRGLHLNIVDVDDDPQSQASFGPRVPVLVGNGEEICHYFLDEDALNHWLEISAGLSPPSDTSS